MRCAVDLGAERAGRLSAALLISASWLALAVGLPQPAYGQSTLYWDVNGATAGRGGTGAWDTTSTFWTASSSGTTGPYVVWSNVGVDDAIFGGTAGAVTLGGPIMAHNLTFETAGYTIAGGTLTLGGATPTITGSGTVSSVIAGTAGLRTGGGNATLTLSGANTFTGPLTVAHGVPAFNVGSLILGSGGSLATSAVTIGTAPASGATFAILQNQGNDQLPNATVTFNAVTGRFSYWQLLGTSQSVLGVIDSTTAGVVENTEQHVGFGNGTLTLTGSGNYAFNGYMRDHAGGSGTLALVKSGTGTQTLSGGNIVYTGTTTVNSGRLILDGAYAFRSATVVNSGATLSWSGAGNLSNSASHTIALNSGGTLENLSPANWTVLNGAVTNAGATTINQTSNATGVGNEGLYLDGGLKGAGTVTINAANAGSGVNFRNNNTTFSGTLIVNGIASGTPFAGSGIGVGGCTTCLTNADITLNGTMELLNRGLGWANISSGILNMGALNGTGVMVGNFSGSGGITTVTLGHTNNNGSFSGVIADGAGNTVRLVKTGTATQTLAGANTYTNGTTISVGTLQIGAGGATGSIVGNVVDNGTLAFNRSDALTFDGLVSGSGQLRQIGAGTTILTAANTYSGGTTISAGALQLGSGGTTGAIVGNVVDDGVLAFNRSNALTFGGIVSGSGQLRQIGAGTTILTGANTYSGGTTISAGTLQLGSGGATGDIVGAVTNNGALAFNRSDEVSFGGLVSGTGQLRQTGTGTTVLTANNSYAGATAVTAGTLRINGDQSAATGLTTVFSGATLGGSGTVGGDVLVQNGGRLSPGNSPGTLTIAGDLTLNASSVLDMEFGQAGVPGGALNDLIVVNGDLTLDGTLNVTVPTGGAFTVGVYRAINYTGSLTNNGITLGTLPAGAVANVQTSVAGQVNLVNTAGQTLSFWDGPVGPKNDSIIQGGTGAWRLGGGANDWTASTGALNSDYTPDAFAVFGGAAGTVTLDDVGGLVGASGVQFAVGGYTLSGDGLRLVGTQTPIRVGDGTAGGASMTATISSVLSGAAQLAKTDLGTLVLSGTNTYTGGTLIDDGTLRISADSNLGGAAGGLAFDGGVLQTTANVSSARGVTLTGAGAFLTDPGTTLTLSDGIAGAGGLAKQGTGSLVLTGAATHTGGTTIVAGTLQIGTGGTAGSLAGDVVDNGVLSFNRSDTATFAGVISGSGGVTQAGAGVTVLTGANTYAGATNVNAGTLLVNGDHTGASGLTTVASGATLGGAGTVGGGVSVAAGGTFAPGGASSVPGTLSILGGLSLAGTSVLNYDFGQAGVPGGPFNDLATVGGALTLDGTINVSLSAGGALDPGVYRVIDYAGALTNNGLTVGATPPGVTFAVQTSVAGQVNLVNSTGLTVSFWDGAAGGRNDGAVTGGAGVWDATNDNWTTNTGAVNAAWPNSAFAVFGGVGGAVAVDDSLGGLSLGGLQFASNGYSISGDPLTLVGAQAVLRVGDGTAAGAGMTATIGSALGGASQLAKADLGTLVLTGANSYTGGTVVNAGLLVVNGDQSAATGLATVNSGATLAGSGVLGGGAMVNNGGAISPGNGGVGVLTISGALTLNAGAVLNMDFGQPDTAGGVLNDLIVVGGNLTLDGTLNVAQTVGGAFGPGIYRVIDYTGALTDNGLAVGALPSDVATVQTSIANQVNLVVTPTPPGGGGGGGGGGGNPPTPPPPSPIYNFWDGAAGPKANSQINGGDGVWQAGVGNTNWTVTSGATNGGYADGSFAIFAGTGGTVSVDAGLGAVTASGLQFAANAYRIQGDDLVLTGPEAIVRVGDGTTAGAAFMATIASELSGGARLVKADAGTLVLAGVNTYTGGTAIQGGTLIGSATSFGAGAIRSDAALVIDQTADASFANAIDGAGTFTKTGAGRLTYTGSGGLSGPTTVAGGALSVNGSLAQSAVTVRSGASLGGAGTVGATTLQAGATIAPAEGALGALTVNGAFAQAAGATYQVQLDPNSSASDRIVVSGAATLADGALLNVARIGTGQYRLGANYTVLTAQGGLTGTFDLTGDVGMLSVFLGLTDRYDANNVYLTVAQVRAFPEVAVTPNQVTTATAVTGPALTDPLLNVQDFEMARAAFDRLSGEPHATLRGVLMTESQMIRDAAFGRLSCTQDERAGCDDVSDRAAGWAQVIGGWGEIDGDGNAASADHTAGGFLTGLDLPASDWRLGAYAGYTRTDWDVDARAASGDVDNYHAGLYAGRSWRALGLRFGAGQTWHSVSADRSVAFPGVSDRLKADYDGTTTQAFADVDYRITVGAVAWTPFANIAHVRVHTDGFGENGGAAALTVRGETMETTVTTLGVRPSTQISLGSAKATLRGTLGWRHAFGDVASTSRNAFAGGDAFAVRGAPLARDAAIAEVGLDMGLGPAGLVSFTYGGQFSDRATDQRLRLDLRVRF